jgi:hypothetical protein
MNMSKPKSIVLLEGTLYVIIAVGGSLGGLLGSTEPLTERAMIAAGVAAIVAGANALKAFLSQAMSKKEE